MAVLQKGSTGTTYRQLSGMYLIQSGHVSSAQYVDLVFGSNNDNDNYKVFKIFLRDFTCDGYEYRARFLSSAGSPITYGHYGGGNHLGEATSSVDSFVWNNSNHIPLSGGHNAASGSGAYPMNLELTVYADISHTNYASNYHFTGMFRGDSSAGYTQGVWGGGTQTGDSDYGIPITTNDESNQRIQYLTYAMYGLGGWTA